MIVVTATLVFVLLVCAPIRFRVDAIIYPQRLSAKVRVKSAAIKVFEEQFELTGRYLRCDGTVSTDVDVTTVNKQTGIDLLKCITIDKVCVSLRNNLLSASVPFVLVQNVLAALATATFCNVSHFQLYTQVVGTFEESSVRLQTVISTSVAELSFCLLKQEVKLWKTRISEKS